jgi:histidine phosphotransfer protein HptB
MIDWSRIGELRDDIGAEDFKEVVELFLEEVDEVISRLKTKADHRRLEQDLHFLKGSALNLGFTAFSDLCQEGERKSACGQARDVDIAKIVSAFERSKSLFESRIQDDLAA